MQKVFTYYTLYSGLRYKWKPGHKCDQSHIYIYLYTLQAKLWHRHLGWVGGQFQSACTWLGGCHISCFLKWTEAVESV